MNFRTLFEAQIIILAMVSVIAFAAQLWASYAPLPPQSNEPGPVIDQPEDDPDRQRVIRLSTNAILFANSYFMFTAIIFLMIGVIAALAVRDGLVSPAALAWLLDS